MDDQTVSAYDEASFVRAGQSMKGNWREDKRKEGEASDPGDHRQQPQCSEYSFDHH